MTGDLVHEAADARPPWLRAEPLRVPEGYELRKVPTPRPKPLTHRGRSKVPFTRFEWGLIEHWAPKFVYSMLGASAYGIGARGDPNAAFEDPTFAWRTCLFLRASTIHISLLHELRSSDVYEDDSALLRVRWPRAKTQALQAPALLPRAHFDEWVRDYLDTPKPATRQAYDHMLGALSDFIEVSTRKPRPNGKPGEFDPGDRVKLNPLRFRHTGLVRWLDPPYRFPPRLVCQWGRTTLRTLTMYWNPEEPEIAARLKESGVA